jgi:predicted phage tail protein
MYKIIAEFWLNLIASPAFAVGSIIVTWAVNAAFAATTAGIMMAMAINMIAASIISKVFFSPEQPNTGFDQGNPGNRTTLPAATDGKLPVVYGEAYSGGQVIDVTISYDNQDIYYVIAICEVTDNG